MLCVKNHTKYYWGNTVGIVSNNNRVESFPANTKPNYFFKENISFKIGLTEVNCDLMSEKR